MPLFRKTKLEPPDDNGDVSKKDTKPDMSKRQRLPSRQEVMDALRVDAIQKHKRSITDESRTVISTCEHDYTLTTGPGNIIVFTCRKCGEVVTRQ